MFNELFWLMTIDAKNITIILKNLELPFVAIWVEISDNISARNWAVAWAEELFYLLFANMTVFFSPQGVPRSLINRRTLIPFAHGGEIGRAVLGS